MAEVEMIRMNYNVSVEQLIRTHLMFYTHINDIYLTRTDMNALVLLGLVGKQYLVDFCNDLVNRKVYLSVSSARNALDSAVEKGLIVKSDSGKSVKKLVELSPELNVSNRKNTLLSINCMCA